MTLTSNLQFVDITNLEPPPCLLCRYLEAQQQRGQKCDNGGGIPKSVIIEVGLEKVLG